MLHHRLSTTHTNTPKADAYHDLKQPQRHLQPKRYACTSPANLISPSFSQCQVSIASPPVLPFSRPPPNHCGCSDSHQTHSHTCNPSRKPGYQQIHYALSKKSSFALPADKLHKYNVSSSSIRLCTRRGRGRCAGHKNMHQQS
jgi:hypothetical protein